MYIGEFSLAFMKKRQNFSELSLQVKIQESTFTQLKPCSFEIVIFRFYFYNFQCVTKNRF